MRQTTDELIESVKRRCLAPSSQNTFSDDDIIDFLNEEMELGLVPMVVSVREDYFLRSKSVNVTSGVYKIPVPERAIGNALKQTFFADANLNKRQLTKTDVDILRVLTQTNGSPEYYFFQGEVLYLVPTPNSTSGTIDMWYLSRPNKLVATADTGAITAIATVSTTTTFTVDTDLSADYAVGDTVDFLSAKSPFVLWKEDVAITAVSFPAGGPYTISVLNADVINANSVIEPIVGDYICLSQTANIPMIPQELHPILAQMVAARLMEALGHTDKLTAVNAKLAMMMDAAFKMIVNRVENQPARIINRNGLLAASGFRMGQNSFR